MGQFCRSLPTLQRLCSSLCLQSGSPLTRGFSSVTTAAPRAPSLAKRLAAIERGELDFSSIKLPQAAAAAAAESSSKPWMPKWMDSFWNGSKRQDVKGQGGMSWEDLEKGATMGVEGYKQYCYQYRLSTPAPRPKTPVVVNRGSRKQAVPDNARLQYLRMCQHEKIAGSMTPSQAAEVQRDPVAAMRNTELLKQVAQQSGYIVPEVQDCISNLISLRATALKLLRWRELGKPLPNNYAEVKAAVQQVNKRLQREERDKFFSHRRSSCPLVHRQRHFFGSACPKTGLPWASCCPAQQQQQHQQLTPTMEQQPLPAAA